MKKHFLGLRTVIYPAKDLQTIKEWYAKALGFPPLFDEPFYVGFNVGGYEWDSIQCSEGSGGVHQLLGRQHIEGLSPF